MIICYNKMVKLNQQTKGKDQEQTTVKKTKKINK